MATKKQHQVAKVLLENVGISLSQAMRQVGYRPSYAKNPQSLMRGKGLRELLDIVLDPAILASKHAQLMNATKVEHMVFPLAMTDDDIKTLLSEANCIVKKFMHSETQTHAWFFAADNQAQDKALDKAYKLLGEYAAEKHEVDVKGLDLASLYERTAAKRKARIKSLNKKNGNKNK